MRNGWYVDENGENQEQEMYFDAANINDEIQAKGLKQVLQERGLWKEGHIKKDMIKILEQQQDFKDDESITQIRLIAFKYNKYSLVIHFPKFHCELNGIENVWMDTKNQYRKQQDFKNKKDQQIIQIINELMDGIPLDRIRKYISNSILYCHLYAGGVADAEITEKIKEVKKVKKRHRGAAEMLLH